MSSVAMSSAAMSSAATSSTATSSVVAQRPFRWEAAYPKDLAWDAPVTPSTLGELLDAAVRDHGPRTALDFRQKRFTYAELGREVDRAAAAFLHAGIRRGDAVAVYLPNCPYHPFVFFGAAKLAARLVHLSPLDAERELAFKLQDSGARLLVTTNIGPFLALARKLLTAGLLDLLIVGEDEAWGALPPGMQVPVVETPTLRSYASFAGTAVAPDAWPRVEPADVALLQYTGGTTGTPKGAILTHGNLTAAVAIYETWGRAQRAAREEPEKVICVLPLFHIYALTTILLLQLRNGNEILLRLRFDVEAILHDIEKQRATAFPGVPTMWTAIANHPGIETRDLSSLRYVSSGGAPLPNEIGNRLERLTGHRLLGGWGMTETAPAGTNIPPDRQDKLGTIGVPMPQIELQIVALDDPRRILGPGETGEIRVRGPNVTQGYWNRPRESAESFVDGYLLTGDIGFMDEDGFFFIVDRKKDMIISGGFNVYPQMIEQAIYEHPAVREVLVIGVPDDYRGEAAKAFVSLRAGAAPFSLDELRAFLADKVGRQEMPAALEFREALPRTPVGKLSKVELRRAAWEPTGRASPPSG